MMIENFRVGIPGYTMAHTAESSASRLTMGLKHWLHATTEPEIGKRDDAGDHRPSHQLLKHSILCHHELGFPDRLQFLRTTIAIAPCAFDVDGLLYVMTVADIGGQFRSEVLVVLVAP